LRQKGVDEGGLADPGLPRDKYHLAFAPARALQGSAARAQPRPPARVARSRGPGERGEN
jgi:hypothetical protein